MAGIVSGPLFHVGCTLGTYRASIVQWEQARLQSEQVALIALRELAAYVQLYKALGGGWNLNDAQSTSSS